MLARVNADHALFDARGPTGDGTPANNYIGRAIVTQAGDVAQFWEWGDGWTQYDHTYGVGVPHWEWGHLALVHGAEADGTIIERGYVNGGQVAQSAPVHPPSGGEAARLYIGWTG